MITLENEKAYTVFEVSEILQCRDETIRNYIKRGKLRAKKIGNAYHIKESALKEFCNKKEG